MTTIQLVIAVAGFISIIAAIFGGAWLNLRSLERQMEAFRNEMRAEFAGLRGEMNARFGEVNTHLSVLDERVGRIERQLEALFVPKPR